MLMDGSARDALSTFDDDQCWLYLNEYIVVYLIFVWVRLVCMYVHGKPQFVYTISQRDATSKAVSLPSPCPNVSNYFVRRINRAPLCTLPSVFRLCSNSNSCAQSLSRRAPTKCCTSHRHWKTTRTSVWPLRTPGHGTTIASCPSCGWTIGNEPSGRPSMWPTRKSTRSSDPKSRRSSRVSTIMSDRTNDIIGRDRCSRVCRIEAHGSTIRRAKRQCAMLPERLAAGRLCIPCMCSACICASGHSASTYRMRPLSW